ncbi:DUF3331 domain-containing protein [Pararobbsia alpina]|uniref:DUF3331 domain-containing protein n=1 Tax=Pararobbsia alpina TaxID=621374 RepID=A0A6S7B9Y4_9BURK|nr:DUF3331 domain-containing protein [Pararobbsia alpina]CAB3793133.1 hypothetical protein LMG28138_03469 [Pararobbsia alpina]
MLKAESNTTSDILSENGSYPTSVVPALPSGHHSSPHPAGRSVQSKSAYGTSSPKGPDPWATTLAAIRQFSSPPHPVRNSQDLPGRSTTAGVPLRPRGTDGSDARTFTVTVLEELPNSLFAVRWVDPTLCNYEEQIWSPCCAVAPGRCALSGQQIKLGDSVYRPRTRGRIVPLNRDAMIMASEMVKVRTIV